MRWYLFGLSITLLFGLSIPPLVGIGEAHRARAVSRHACRVSWEVCETSRGMVIPPVGPAKCSWRRGGFDSFEFLTATGKACDWDDAGEYTADADGLQDVCTDALNSCESYLEERP